MELQFATVVPVLHETTGASGFIVMISSFMKIRMLRKSELDEIYGDGDDNGCNIIMMILKITVLIIISKS